MKPKKTVKRLTTKGRAKKQAAKRQNRLAVRKLKGQPAQDIYRTPSKKGKGEHKLKNFKYDMFEFGNPYPYSVKSSLNPQPKRQAGEKIKPGARTHLSDKQKTNKKTLASRKKSNYARKKKVNEIKIRMKNKRHK